MMEKQKVCLLAVLLLPLFFSCGQSSAVSVSSSSSIKSSVEEKANYSLTEKVYYAGTENPAQVMDVYVPLLKTSLNPGIVLVHGGAFKFGDEKMFSSSAKWLANHGFTVCCMSYRLYQEKLFPAAIGDEKAAVRYLRKNASEYNVNPDQIVTWGESAGAYLAVMAALTSQDSYFNSDVEANLDVSSAVQFAVDFYGPMSVKTYKDGGICNFLGITADQIDANADLVSKSDPASYVSSFTTSTAPQFIIQHGSADTTVSNEESKYLYSHLKEAWGESKASLEIKEGLKHMDSGFYTDENMEFVSSAITSYFAKA